MNEVGRELTVRDLKPMTVVVVKPPDRNCYLTFWVGAVSPEAVVFYAGELRWHVVNFVQPDGTLHDDCGRTVRCSSISVRYEL